MSFPQNFSETDWSLAAGKHSFYDILEVSPQSSQAHIRDAYRCKSKQCHPDTALLDQVEAARQFQILNTAYDTLRFPEKRVQYDEWLLQTRSQSPVPALKLEQNSSSNSSTVSTKIQTAAFLDSKDRPLSPGEVFALFILGLTFLFCLFVAIFLGVSRGEMLVQSMPSDSSLIHQLKSFNVIPKPQVSETVQKESRVTPRSSTMTENYSVAIHKVQQGSPMPIPLFPAVKSK